MKILVKKEMENRIRKENILKTRNRKKSTPIDEKSMFLLGLRDECPQCGE